jgi:hypothetical protein
MKKIKKHSILKTIIRLLFSNVGLIFMVIVYTTSGAFIFQLLEKHANVQACQEVSGNEKKILSKYTNKLFKLYFARNEIEMNGTSVEYNKLSNTSLISQSDEIETILRGLRKELISLIDSYHYYWNVCIEEVTWNFQSSLLFALTLITTIGT